MHTPDKGIRHTGCEGGTSGGCLFTRSIEMQSYSTVVLTLMLTIKDSKFDEWKSVHKSGEDFLHSSRCTCSKTVILHTKAALFISHMYVYFYHIDIHWHSTIACYAQLMQYNKQYDPSMARNLFISVSLLLGRFWNTQESNLPYTSHSQNRYKVPEQYTTLRTGFRNIPKPSNVLLHDSSDELRLVLDDTWFMTIGNAGGKERPQ